MNQTLAPFNHPGEHLLAELVIGAAWAPVGQMLRLGWVALNLAACLWVARIGIDRSKA